MSIGEYLAVFASIILGLAVGDMVQSLHRLLVAGRLVKWDWLTPAAALFILVDLIGLWWATFGWYRTATDLTVIGFFPDLLLFILYYLLAAACLPDEVSPSGLDLRAFYLHRARYFWTLSAVSMVATILFVGPRYAPGGWQAVAADQTGNLIILPLFVLGAASRRLWVHRLLVAGLLAFFVYDYSGYDMTESMRRSSSAIEQAAR